MVRPCIDEVSDDGGGEDPPWTIDCEAREVIPDCSVEPGPPDGAGWIEVEQDVIVFVKSTMIVVL